MDSKSNNSNLESNKKNNCGNLKGKVEEGYECPYCKGKKIIKFGFYKGIQRYKCKNENCCKTFINDINNPFRYSKKFKEQWRECFECFTQGLTIRECSSKMGIAIVTAFFWRHRFLHDLNKKNNVETIGSYVELTKLVTIENFKGDRNYHGEERDKIIVINAVNDFIEVASIIAARNFLGVYSIRDNIIPRLDRRAYVVGFLDGRIKNFAKAFNEINKVKITAINTDISEIDKTYSNKVRMWLSKFNGVATKYLEHYLSWRAFEYKNSVEFTDSGTVIEKVGFNNDVKPEIDTYISWDNIKAKVISV